MKYLGCAYYPEYWGPKRFQADARLMAEAGINIARIGEFAWSRLEPEEGRFTLDWLHECLDTLGRHSIDVVMCTPTAAPPAWLTQAYPDVCLVRADGRRAEHGSRRHYCSTSETYRRHTARVITALASELRPHKNVVGWQLDNEFGPEAGWCHCENCQSRFQAWLRERYGSLDALGQAWKTGFWSVDYSDWRQIRLGDAAQSLYSSRNLDSKRFWSDMMIEYARFQTELLRRLHPGAFVSTNGMGPIFSPMDYYKLFAFLDVACDDLYFDIATMDHNVLAMNVFRNIKPGRRYWVTETGAGALDHNRPPQAEQFRAWAWSSLAHGGDAHFVFRWRTCLSGQEQELQGMLEHSGRPRHRYQAVKACFTEIEGLREELADLPLPEAPVALVQDYNVLWGYEASRVGADVNYPGLIGRLHREFYDRHVAVDVIPPERDLGGYRLVVLPSLMMIAADFAKRLTRFVREGGTVLAVGQIGLRDFADNYLDTPGPEHLRELLGVTIEGGMYLASHVGPDEALWVPAPSRRQVAVGLKGKLERDGVAGPFTARTWVADLTLAGKGRALLTFEGEAYPRQPAVVETATGRGGALYAGTVNPDDALLSALADAALRRAGVERGPVTPRHVEVVTRGRLTFAVNHTDQTVSVPLGRTRKTVLGRVRGGIAELGPYGVAVVRNV